MCTTTSTARPDFSKFKTYKWIALKMEAPIGNVTDEQIKAASDSAFARKGLRKVDDDGSADLFIGYQITEHIDEEFAGFRPGWTTGQSAREPQRARVSLF